MLEFSGATSPGAFVTLSVGDDNLFDDGGAIADEDGNFAFTLRLDGELQLTRISVRARSQAGEEVVETASIFFATERSVELETSLGNIEIELLAAEAPLTVENFLRYFNRNERLVVHRAPTNFVVQSGSFTFNDGQISSVQTEPAIPNEFDPVNSNLRGTVSVALLSGQPDSGTSGWFINTVDNAGLDSALHTVFGRISAESFEVLDAINGLPIFDLRELLGNSAFGETPLRNYSPFSDSLTGTVDTIQGEVLVTGQGTSFLSEVPPDNLVSIDGRTYSVERIISDTQLELTIPAESSISSSLASINAIPGEDNFVFVASL